jgi:hypothetical protein
MTLTYTLASPIKAHGAEITKLELAMPTTKDVRQLGYPFSATTGPKGEPDIVLFPDVGARWISRLANIPMSSVDQLLPGDFLNLHTSLCDHFMLPEAANNG